MDGVSRHFLDGVEVTEPLGWSDFTEELVRDVDRRFIAVKYEGTLTFTHDGYAILNDSFRDNGHCGIVTYEARQMCQGEERPVVRGSIIVADIKFNLTRCEAECSIADDGIGARIINNIAIPISPNAENTKNGLDLPEVAPSDIELFDPAAAANTYLTGSRRGWDWYAAMRHAVRYITDNESTFISDFYEALSDDERYWISNGYSIRSASITLVRTSWTFESLFNELAKKYNLWIGVVRDSNGNPILRCEPESYWYSSTGTQGHPDIQDLIRTCEASRLYAKVDVGCSKAIKETETTLSLPYIPLRGFVEESFHLSGVCNTDRSLDLVNECVIDTNVIEDVAVNGNTDYDDDLFIVQYNRSTLRAVKGAYLQPGTNPYLYNEQLQNGIVIDRYDLPSSVGAYYDPVDASFRAERTRPPVDNPYLNADPGASAIVENETPTRFNDDYSGANFDTSNAWGNGTAQGTPVSQANSRYTAAGDGYYEFEVFARWRVVQQVVPRNGPLALAYFVQLQLEIQRFDSGNNLISTQTQDSAQSAAPFADVSMTAIFGTSLNTGDYIIINNRFLIQNPTWITGIPDENLAGLNLPGVTFQRLPNWYIRTNFVASGGYVESGGNGAVVRYEYERHCDTSSWVSLTADPRQRIMISGGPTPDIPTHIISAKRNVSTGATEWVMLQEP